MPEHVSVAEVEPGLRFTSGISTRIASHCLKHLIGAVEKGQLGLEMKMHEGRSHGRFDSRIARREVKPGYMGRTQGLTVKLNTLLAVCFVGVDESCTVKVRL